MLPWKTETNAAKNAKQEQEAKMQGMWFVYYAGEGDPVGPYPGSMLYEYENRPNENRLKSRLNNRQNNIMFRVHTNTSPPTSDGILDHCCA